MRIESGLRGLNRSLFVAQNLWGGLGVKDLNSFNRVLFGKWLWRYFDDRESLWANVINSIHGGLSIRESGVVLDRVEGFFDL